LHNTERLANAYLSAMLEEFRHLRDHTSGSVFLTELHSFILGNLNKPLSVDLLAERANVSPRQFLRIYRRECGCSPMVDIRRIRLENAKKLIRSTLLPLKTIAPLVGYAAESELSKAFRKQFGYPPNQARASLSVRNPSSFFPAGPINHVRLSYPLLLCAHDLRNT
jgi:transcriptional regulator GlxA family with amidase domain